MTRKQMPSAAQRRVLEAMRDGAELRWYPGFNAHACLANKWLSRVNVPTFFAIYNAGWVIDSGAKAGPSYAYVPHTLTAIGRDALAQCTAPQGEHSQGVE